MGFAVKGQIVADARETTWLLMLSAPQRKGKREQTRKQKKEGERQKRGRGRALRGANAKKRLKGRTKKRGVDTRG